MSLCEITPRAAIKDMNKFTVSSIYIHAFVEYCYFHIIWRYAHITPHSAAALCRQYVDGTRFKIMRIRIGAYCESCAAKHTAAKIEYFAINIESSTERHTDVSIRAHGYNENTHLPCALILMSALYH